METKVSDAEAIAEKRINRAGRPAASAAERCITYLEAAKAKIGPLKGIRPLKFSRIQNRSRLRVDIARRQST